MKICLSVVACDLLGTGLSYEADIDLTVRAIAVILGVLWFGWRAYSENFTEA